jgi:hypothetical protein
MLLPPWVPWFVSAAGSRTRNCSVSAPLHLLPRPAEASNASVDGHWVDRSFAGGRATDPTPASRASSRTLT